MKALQENSVLDKIDLADWFGIKPNTFAAQKKQKLNELAEFCNFELRETKKGTFRNVLILEVYEPVYRKHQKPLKREFLNWIENGGIEEVASQNEDHVFSYPIVVNYYCAQHGIPYDGPHYLKMREDGISDTGHRLNEGKRRAPNNEFCEWHYLYRLLRKYQMEQGVKLGSRVNCCADSFNPTLLRKETLEDQEIQNKIYQKYFGRLNYQDVCELTDIVAYGEITEEEREEIINNTIIKTLSDRTKRKLVAHECALAGVLRREGREYGTTKEVSIKNFAGELDNIFEGDFEF